VDLDDLLLAEADRLGAGQCTHRGRTSGVDAAQVEGNPRLLGRAVRNLVDNAARHAESRVVLGL
jgi:signal transduction histidine kinase